MRDVEPVERRERIAVRRLRQLLVNVHDRRICFRRIVIRGQIERALQLVALIAGVIDHLHALRPQEILLLRIRVGDARAVFEFRVAQIEIREILRRLARIKINPGVFGLQQRLVMRVIPMQHVDSRASRLDHADPALLGPLAIRRDIHRLRQIDALLFGSRRNRVA